MVETIVRWEGREERRKDQKTFQGRLSECLSTTLANRRDLALNWTRSPFFFLFLYMKKGGKFDSVGTIYLPVCVGRKCVSIAFLRGFDASFLSLPYSSLANVSIVIHLC